MSNEEETTVNPEVMEETKPAEDVCALKPLIRIMSHDFIFGFIWRGMGYRMHFLRILSDDLPIFRTCHASIDAIIFVNYSFYILLNGLDMILTFFVDQQSCFRPNEEEEA